MTFCIDASYVFETIATNKDWKFVKTSTPIKLDGIAKQPFAPVGGKLASGGYVIMRNGQHENVILAQAFDSNNNKIKSFYVQRGVSWLSQPRFGCLNNGNYVVAWQNTRNVNGTDINEVSFKIYNLHHQELKHVTIPIAKYVYYMFLSFEWGFAIGIPGNPQTQIKFNEYDNEGTFKKVWANVNIPDIRGSSSIMQLKGIHKGKIAITQRTFWGGSLFLQILDLSTGELLTKDKITLIAGLLVQKSSHRALALSTGEILIYTSQIEGGYKMAIFDIKGQITQDYKTITSKYGGLSNDISFIEMPNVNGNVIVSCYTASWWVACNFFDLHLHNSTQDFMISVGARPTLFPWSPNSMLMGNPGRGGTWITEFSLIDQSYTTGSPTKRPTNTPSKTPTQSPTKKPTKRPTTNPTIRPYQRPKFIEDIPKQIVRVGETPIYQIPVDSIIDPKQDVGKLTWIFESPQGSKPGWIYFIAGNSAKPILVAFPNSDDDIGYYWFTIKCINPNGLVNSIPIRYQVVSKTN